MNKNPNQPQTNDVVLGGQSPSPTSLSPCPVCKTEYNQGKVNRCSVCNWDLTPCPEAFVEKYNAQLAWAKEMWINSQVQEKQFHASQSQLEEVKQDKARFEGEVLHRLEQLEQAQDNSGAVSWAGVPHNASNVNELENQLSKIKEQLNKADQERKKLQLEVAQLSLQVAKSEAEPQKKIADAPLLISETSIDYSRLRNFLADGEWEKANLETIAIINTALYKIGVEVIKDETLLELMDYVRGYNTTYSSWMVRRATYYDEQSEEDNNYYDAFQQFSCLALSFIDKLWTEYSYGRFGFSVQKRLYELCNKDITALFIAVNWGYWDAEKEKYIPEDKEYSINAPVGHLPIFYVASYNHNDYSMMIHYLPSFLEKIAICGFD